MNRNSIIFIQENEIENVVCQTGVFGASPDGNAPTTPSFST